VIGTTLSHFKITAKLGEGGMGEVYRATDTKLRRDVALKILPEEMASDPERLERFQREATMLAALDHPSIVGVFSVEESDGVHFLTMQLVEGDSLDRLIPEGGLPIEQTFEIAVAIVEALAAAHDKGIIHRDLKPGNIMVTPDRRIKVLDFGLAKITGSQEGAALDSALPTALRTSEGVVMGTVPYMSPEQVEGRMVDHRSDIFSLGVILYEMATGSRPFGGASQAALVSSILRDPPPALSDHRSDLPDELGRLILRCLEKVPERRPQTAAEMHAALTAMPRLEVSGSVPTRQSGPRDEGPSIVVLPFANLSPDPDNEYFADGLTEEIIADLSKVGALRVISRTSAMQLKGAKKDVRTIGRDLGVRYVLEGGVRKAGNSLRITAQLIDAESDAHLWSEKYSGTMDDIFEVQERVSREIVGVLDVTLTSDENRRLAERPIANVRAFELYLQARQEIRRIEGNALPGSTPTCGSSTRRRLRHSRSSSARPTCPRPTRCSDPSGTSVAGCRRRSGTANAHSKGRPTTRTRSFTWAPAIWPPGRPRRPWRPAGAWWRSTLSPRSPGWSWARPTGSSAGRTTRYRNSSAAWSSTPRTSSSTGPPVIPTPPWAGSPKPGAMRTSATRPGPTRPTPGSSCRSSTRWKAGRRPRSSGLQTST
jgi:serine/threonine protein kinase